MSRRTYWTGLSLSLVPAVIYATAFVVAGSAPTVSLVMYAAVPVLYFIVTMLLR